MAIDYSVFASVRCGLPKGKPRVLAVTQKKSDHDRKLAKAYAAVDLRENNVCQVTGVELVPRTSDWKRLREHHHLKGRRVKPEWVYVPKRIALVSKHCHDLLTSKVLLTDDTDASQPMHFYWNPRQVKPGKEPFRLRPSVRKAAA